MRIRHYALFQSGISELDWEVLRGEETEASYHVPFDKERYLARVEAVPPNAITSYIASFVQERSLHTVMSIGIGIGALEFQLRGSVDKLIVTDITESITRIGSFGIFDDARRFDILIDPMPQMDIDLVVLPRIDTEFTDAELRSIYSKLHSGGVRFVCLVPAGFLNLRMILVEGRTWLRGAMKGTRPVFCGFFRDYRGLQRTWAERYNVVLADKSAPIVFLEAN